MRILSLLLLGVSCGFLDAQVEPQPKVTFNTNSPAEAQVPALHQAWAAEHDAIQRQLLADQLVEAVIHEYGKQEPEIVAEVARDGLPQNVISFVGAPEKVTLGEITTLAGVHADPDAYPAVGPVFRRIAANRIEAWTPKEGWLFDGKGNLLVHVQVPRRDGTGREWFGAFLPDGTWITTDLWNDDKQLNCYTAKGEWKWERKGADILARLPKPKTPPDELDYPVSSSIGWARADKTGKRWLINLGTEFGRALAYLSPGGKVKPFPDAASMWSEVYPRAMGVRGYFIDFFIGSDDAKENLTRGEAGHGVEVGWPRYDWANNRTVIIPEGDDNFGFWPGSHAVFLEARGASYQDPKHVWFFDAQGKYQGEVIGSRFADAANGRDLLVQDADDNVLRLTRGKDGLAVPQARQFLWPDGSVAVPITIYDDLQFGFFQRGSGMAGFTDDARRARRTADVVLAKWKG